MRAQLEALIDATKMPNVRLQIIPFEYGGHAAAGGSFSILRFPDQDLPDIVYVEQLDSALYFDKREDVEHYAAAMERLAVEADPPADTPERLEGSLPNSTLGPAESAPRRSVSPAETMDSEVHLRLRRG